MLNANLKNVLLNWQLNEDSLLKELMTIIKEILSKNKNALFH